MFDACIYFQLNTLTRKVNQIWESHFDRIGLSPSLGYCLMVILQNHGITNKELAHIMELDQSTVTRLIDGLQKADLVIREYEGKITKIFPSAKGSRSKKQLESTMSDIYQHLAEAGILAGANKLLPNLQKLKTAFEKK